METDKKTFTYEELKQLVGSRNAEKAWRGPRHSAMVLKVRCRRRSPPKNRRLSIGPLSTTSVFLDVVDGLRGPILWWFRAKSLPCHPATFLIASPALLPERAEACLINDALG